MIFGNGLKKLDFARKNLDGRAKCLAPKNEKNHWSGVILLIRKKLCSFNIIGFPYYFQFFIRR